MTPIAVLISDIHYNLQTLKLADSALRQAICEANELEVPLIIAGDLHDTKANIRGECISAMMQTFALPRVEPLILRGNHDALNEKSIEHSLGFLQNLANVVIHPLQIRNIYMIPYHHDAEELRDYLKTIPKGSKIIMHQGVIGSDSGDYFQDKSALTKEDLAGFRVISGHYHRRQSFDLPDGGKFDYIGNPYTLSFSEAEDPEKGFQTLYSDGSLEFFPTNLRRHKIIERFYEDLSRIERTDKSNKVHKDLYWIKIHGSQEELSKLSRKRISEIFGLESFKLDLIPDEIVTTLNSIEKKTPSETLDALIDSLSNVSEDQKTRLKNMWPDFMRSNNE